MRLEAFCWGKASLGGRTIATSRKSFSHGLFSLNLTRRVDLTWKGDTSIADCFVSSLCLGIKKCEIMIGRLKSRWKFHDKWGNQIFWSQVFCLLLYALETAKHRVLRQKELSGCFLLWDCSFWRLGTKRFSTIKDFVVLVLIFSFVSLAPRLCINPT